jgi:AcrR family transcriptional regulator
MTRMSTRYEMTGRTRQKARTREALVRATRELLGAGINPTVEQTADRARVSRTTAYRYFPNQRSLLAATYPELDQASLLGESPSGDPAARLQIVVEAFTTQILDHEPELRTALRLSLDPDSTAYLPLRQGRAIGWIEDALAPLRADLSTAAIHRLALAIRATTGIEALIWLTDVAGLAKSDAVELMRSSAQALLESTPREIRTNTRRGLAE